MFKFAVYAERRVTPNHPPGAASIMEQELLLVGEWPADWKFPVAGEWVNIDGIIYPIDTIQYEPARDAFAKDTVGLIVDRSKAVGVTHKKSQGENR